mgnify:CR=1 FL=1
MAIVGTFGYPMGMAAVDWVVEFDIYRLQVCIRSRERI